MISQADFRDAFKAALPIMGGYVAIGLPCGILCNSIGLNWIQVLLLSALFYSGAGQFMIPNLYLAGTQVVSSIASISLVNTRQMLYAASFAPYCEHVSRPLAFIFAATVTDESYGVSIARFKEGNWSVGRALAVNLLSQSSWTIANVIGNIAGSILSVPLPLASFAMTSIFICLLVTQKKTSANIIAAVFAMLGVYLCKSFGLSGPAILIGALIGLLCAVIYQRIAFRGQSDSENSQEAHCQEEAK